ncbi:acyl carrier protein [Streptosporangium canum]|uniref:acyl carrier protein n=1 Tax=Streptosporangium canum TaxID=324952 RepID=UPI00341237F9
MTARHAADADAIPDATAQGAADGGVISGVVVQGAADADAIPGVAVRRAAGADGASGLAARLAAMISTACDGRLTAEEVLASGASLSALGVTSLALLRLIDAVEDEFDVDLDLGGGASYLDSFPLLVGYVDARTS